MLLYVLKRIVYVTPVALGVSIFCFLLVHLAPGDPLTAVMPVDANGGAAGRNARAAYGFDKPLPIPIWASGCGRCSTAISGQSIATGRPVLSEGQPRRRQTRSSSRSVATLIGFTFGTFFRFRPPATSANSVLDKAAVGGSPCLGVSVPHYWLGIVMVIIFSATLGWLPPDPARGPRRPFRQTGGPTSSICAT